MGEVYGWDAISQKGFFVLNLLSESFCKEAPSAGATLSKVALFLLNLHFGQLFWT